MPYLSNEYAAEVQAAYEVDLWGRLQSLTQAANAQVASARASHDAVELGITAAVVSGYIRLIALDALIELSRRTLVSRERSLALTQSRQARGYATGLESAQAESEYRVTAQAVPQFELAAEQQQQALNVLLGRVPGPVERTDTFSSIVVPELPSAGLPSELVRRRPDVAASELQLVSADEQLRAARGQLLPAVRLSAAIGRAGASVLPDGPFTIWSVGGSVLAPIFNGGRLRAQVHADDARREQALIAYQRAVLIAFAEVETQLSAYEKLNAQATQVEAQRRALESALRMADNRYKEGYSSYLDELLAQRSLFSAEQSAIQLKADLLVAQVNLYRALGGGWDRTRDER